MDLSLAATERIPPGQPAYRLRWNDPVGSGLAMSRQFRLETSSGNAENCRYGPFWAKSHRRRLRLILSVRTREMPSDSAISSRRPAIRSCSQARSRTVLGSRSP
jgi:hypothetical protein